jgi:hypothetical protein
MRVHRSANGLSAEFGGASGGSINVVTKSGTNQFRGDAFIFGQNGALNAREQLTCDSGKADLSHYRAGLALGGPFIKDHAFFCSAFEQEHTRDQNSSDIDPGVASLVNTMLATGAFRGFGVHAIRQGFFPVAQAETEASGRFNHQADHNSIMLRYAFTNNREASDAFSTGGLTDASGRGGSFTQDHALVSLHFHDLRATCATRLMHRGADPATIQSVLRHSNSKMTLERYTRSIDERKRQALEKIAD